MNEGNKVARRVKRKARVRKKILGTLERPRLSVFRSNKHMLAQVVDDTDGKTLTCVHSFVKGKEENANIEKCKELGKALAGKCKEKKIARIVFDKNGYAYHGRVKAFADGVREGGIEF